MWRSGVGGVSSPSPASWTPGSLQPPSGLSHVVFTQGCSSMPGMHTSSCSKMHTSSSSCGQLNLRAASTLDDAFSSDRNGASWPPPSVAVGETLDPGLEDAPARGEHVTTASGPSRLSVAPGSMRAGSAGSLLPTPTSASCCSRRRRRPCEAGGFLAPDRPAAGVAGVQPQSSLGALPLLDAPAISAWIARLAAPVFSNNDACPSGIPGVVASGLSMPPGMPRSSRLRLELPRDADAVLQPSAAREDDAALEPGAAATAAVAGPARIVAVLSPTLGAGARSCTDARGGRHAPPRLWFGLWRGLSTGVLHGLWPGAVTCASDLATPVARRGGGFFFLFLRLAESFLGDRCGTRSGLSRGLLPSPRRMAVCAALSPAELSKAGYPLGRDVKRCHKNASASSNG
mmetsp:Transcript_25896/g.72246  ORF Transcript_25896/g.72246 Transcript_25896/m.72246 type:complete len:401 (-) Transcript_25896:500-1702(-)